MGKMVVENDSTPAQCSNISYFTMEKMVIGGDSIPDNENTKTNVSKKVKKDTPENTNNQPHTDLNNIDNKFLAEAIEKMDKEIFFSVASAKSKTIAVHKKRLEVEMLPIYQQINTAISQGKYEIILKLTRDQRNFLANKNFGCSSLGSSTVNGETVYTMKISWY